MATSRADEDKVLSFEERQLVAKSHHPDIYEVPSADLADTRSRLRALLAKETTLARQKRREIKGTADARGKSFPGTAARPASRKQVFAASIKRLTKELSARMKLERLPPHIRAMREALARKRAEKFETIASQDATAGQGMTSTATPRRFTRINPAKVGSISQRTKNNQAKRDRRTSTARGV